MAQGGRGGGGLHQPPLMAEFIIETETNYLSETDNSSRYKSGVKTNYGPKSICMTIRHADR